MVKWSGLTKIKERIFEDLLPKKHLLLEFGGKGQI